MSAKNDSNAPGHLAVDLGASGGRVAHGVVEGGKLSFEVVHSFPNGAVPVMDRLCWNHIGLWQEVLHGLRSAGAKGTILSVGVNSWGVDHALLDRRDNVLDGVRHYRDPRTTGVMDGVLSEIPARDIYQATGIQFMPINTIYQLISTQRDSPEMMDVADRLLMVPDLLHFWLSGRKVCEVTDASTSQLLDPRSRTWALPLIDRLKIPSRIFGELVEPGSEIGPLLPSLASMAGLESAVVVAPGAHDTASAVAAVPADGGSDWAYISSGTWSLVGLETSAPILSDDAFQSNLTNEAGIANSNRLLKNVMGLWLLQECRRAWANPSYRDLYEEAEAESDCPLVDTNDPRFLQPNDDMPGQIVDFCRESGQSVPSRRGGFVRCIVESLAYAAAGVVDCLERVADRRISTIHVVGGGSQIDLLNQLIADVSGRRVIAGPVEATLMGNLLVQAQCLGAIPPGSVRDIVRSSVQLREFKPLAPPSGERRIFARRVVKT